MNFGRRITRTLASAFAILSIASAVAAAQEHPGKRLSSIVSVAVDEYAKGIDDRGGLISGAEYDEALGFLADAREVSRRLPGPSALRVQALLDTLIAAAAAKQPPEQLRTIHARFMQALGNEGALDMPTRGIDLGAGARTYASSCASCHGAQGLGDGDAARGLNPAPPAIGTSALMREVSPAMAFRIVSVGVRGTSMPAFANTLPPDRRWDVVAYLASMRGPTAQRRLGEGLFLQRCASCHGLSGGGDGTLSAALSTVPPEIGSFVWQAERSDAQLAQAIANGVPGTAMPPSRDLSPDEVTSIVAYLRELATRPDSGAAVAAAASAGTPHDASAVGGRVIRTLDDALAAARGGRTAEAADRAFDAYIAFEPLEAPARARNPGLVATMERHFADFKGAVRANDLRSAEQSRNAIDAGLPKIIELTQTSTSAWGAFLQSLLIILREGFEAILVIGAVVAFLLKTGHRERLRSIWTGVGLGILASALTAVVLATTLSAIPASREILEGVTLLVAVAVLFSVSYWLISKVEAAKWQQFIREKVNAALEQGGGKALALVAFLAVYREGAETALFYQALFAEGSRLVLPLSLGILAGGAALAVIFTLFYRYGVRIPLRPFFSVSSALLYYMAFVFAGKGIRELQEGNAVSTTILPGFPHIEAMGIFPSVETLLAQLVLVVLLIFALLRTFWPRRSVTLPTLPPASSVPPVELEARIATMQARIEELEQRLASLDAQRDDLPV